MEKINYWLIEMNPEVWDVSKAELGDREVMASKNNGGALRPLLGDMKVGELILAYEAAQNKHISRILVVNAEREKISDDNYRDLVVKVIADIPAVSLDEIKAKIPDLHKRIASPAAIHKLTADDYQAVLKLAYSK